MVQPSTVEPVTIQPDTVEAGSAAPPHGDAVRRSDVPALFPPPGYAHTAVVASGTRLAFLAGAVPLDADGRVVGLGDPVVQAHQVLANLEAALRHVGSDLTQVVASTVYVVSADPGPLSDVWEVVKASGLRTGPHTSTLVGVACLGYTGQLVEITVTAVVPDDAAVEG